MKIVKVFYDVETTGVDERKHSIHQIAGFIEVDGKIVERFNMFTRPHPKAQFSDEALEICGKTKEELLAYPEMSKVHKKFVGMLSNYIDRFNPKEKAFLIGYNNRSFDDKFLRAWFEQCNDKYFGSQFWSDSLDVLVLASQYLIQRRHIMINFKLATVAKFLGIEVQEEKLHDAFYDVDLTHQIYMITVGLEIE